VVLRCRRCGPPTVTIGSTISGASFRPRSVPLLFNVVFSGAGDGVHLLRMCPEWFGAAWSWRTGRHGDRPRHDLPVAVSAWLAAAASPPASAPARPSTCRAIRMWPRRRHGQLTAMSGDSTSGPRSPRESSYAQVSAKDKYSGTAGLRLADGEHQQRGSAERAALDPRA